MKTARAITIDHIFEGYIPALSAEERQQLEDNLVQHGGARDPLVVWRDGSTDTLIDGHNRYEICTRLGLKYAVVPMEFASRVEAADWIDRNQLGRRNLSKQDYKMLLGRRYNRAKFADNSRPANDNAAKDRGGQNDHRDKTAEKLAKEHGCGEKTVRRAGEFQAAAETLGIEKEIASGAIKATTATLKKAAKSLPDQPTQEEIEQAVSEVKKAAAKKPKGTRKASSKFGQYPPTKCLEAVEFYATEFLQRCPKRVQEMKTVLVRLIASCDATK